jgi:hypothetical protein
MTQGACYTCGITGHYKDQCPNKNKSVRCYFCNGYGHYQEKCPQKLLQKKQEEKQAAEQLLLEQKAINEKWLEDKLPNLPKPILNVDELIAFFSQPLFSNDITTYLNLHIMYDKIFKCSLFHGKIFIYGGKKSHHSLISSMPIDEFIQFLEQKGTITKISYHICTDPIGMVQCLESANIAQCESTGKKSKIYKINSQTVMNSYDHRGWEDNVTNEALVKQTYTTYISNYNLEVDILRNRF